MTGDQTQQQGDRSTEQRRFRKKPVVIEAMQVLRLPVDSPEREPLLEWLEGCDSWVQHENGAISVGTLEGVMRADPGDWIIKGVKGEFYPCKPDIFEATYEPA